MVVQERRPIDLEEGWAVIQKGITKQKNILEGKPEPQFSGDDYMMLFITIYNMCTQKAPHGHSQYLYDKYRESFEEYITSTVLPSLREKHDELMLKELVRRWSNHKIMVRRLSRFFDYLDQYFIARNSLTPLKEVGLNCFRELVYQGIKGQVKDAVIALICKEREGGHINRALLKNVLDIFVEIRGLGRMECYEDDFEDFLLKDTTEYYSVKAQIWITKYPSPDYTNKAEECLKREKERVGHYLHCSSEQKLLKVEDLSRTYLSTVMTNDLEPISASNKVASEDDLPRVCKGIMGSVVLVRFAPKDDSAFEKYIKSLISKSASRDDKRKWEKILQEILQKKPKGCIYSTGFVVREDPTFILTCAHSVDQVFNKHHPIEANTIKNLYKIAVTCDHLEHELRLEKNINLSNRVFVPAQVMEVDSPKDLLLIQVKEGICGKNHEPLELAQNLPDPPETVAMVSWPYRRHGTVCKGHMCNKKRRYSELFDYFGDADGYNFTSLEVNMGCPDGSSGAPLFDLAGKVIGLLHGGGGPDRFHYCVSLEDIRAFLNHCGVI